MWVIPKTSSNPLDNLNARLLGKPVLICKQKYPPKAPPAELQRWRLSYLIRTRSDVSISFHLHRGRCDI